jgi:hypothetical protein
MIGYLTNFNYFARKLKRLLDDFLEVWKNDIFQRNKSQKIT